MKVVIINEKIFRKKNGYKKKSNFDKSILNKEYDVYAIIKLKRIEYYLLLMGRELEYIHTDSVSIVDEKIPSDWIYRKLKKGYKIEYGGISLCTEYGYILVKNYIGPEIFIDDKSFLINILYEPGDAAKFFYENYIKKNEK